MAKRCVCEKKKERTTMNRIEDVEKNAINRTICMMIAMKSLFFRWYAL